MGEGHLGRSSSQRKVPVAEVCLVCLKSSEKAMCLEWREQEVELYEGRTQR